MITPFVSSLRLGYVLTHRTRPYITKLEARNQGFAKIYSFSNCKHYFVKIRDYYGQGFLLSGMFWYLSFFSIRPPPGLLPLLGPLERYVMPTIDAALLISSRAGADLGQI